MIVCVQYISVAQKRALHISGYVMPFIFFSSCNLFVMKYVIVPESNVLIQSCVNLLLQQRTRSDLDGKIKAAKTC